MSSVIQLLRWIVAEPLFFLGILTAVSVRILPRVRRISTDDWSNKRREFDEFVEYYRVSRVWWVSSLIGALFAATIGGSGGILLDFVAFSIFVVPVILYYYRFSPFGFRCNYIPLDAGQDAEQNGCRPRNGVYTLLLEMEAGENIEDYQLSVHTPSGAILDRVDGNTSHLDDDRQILYGVAKNELGTYTEALYVKKTGSISPDGELVLIKSQGENNTLESIRLLPPK